MIAISIRQPWADMIIYTMKDVENRSWRCPDEYIGQRVLVHVSKTPDKEAMKRFDVESVSHCGGIVGSIIITKCVFSSYPSPWSIDGRWHWVLSDPRKLTFHPCRGRLGFFDVDYPFDTKINLLDKE